MDLLGRDATFAALAAGQGFTTARQRLLAENIANVNTPNYKRRDLDARGFEAQMAAALSGPRDEQVERLGCSLAREVVEESWSYRVDGGGIDLDREMVLHAETSALGSAFSALLAKRLQMYKSVLRDGRI
jgi:flagellar basal-body rod protein FlgB